MRCVQVLHGGESYNLRVLELQPAPAVSVIDTDMAADVGPSIETEGYLRAREEAEAREAERARQAAEAAERAAAKVRACLAALARVVRKHDCTATQRCAAKAAAATALITCARCPPALPDLVCQAVAAEQAEQQRAADAAARRLALQAEKAALLAPEPAAADAAVASLVFRLPDGERLARRFGLGQRVQELHDFVDSKVCCWRLLGTRWAHACVDVARVRGCACCSTAPACLCLSAAASAALPAARTPQGAGGCWPGSYRLVAQFPRRVLDEPGLTLQDAGLTPGQQALFLERTEEMQEAS